MTIALRKNNPKLSFYGGFYDIKMSDGVREHKKIVVCGCTFPWILFFFFSGLTIECFQCNSVEHPGCVDLTINDTSSRYYRECDGDYQGHEPFCRKVATESKLYTQKKKKWKLKKNWIMTLTLVFDTICACWVVTSACA